MKRSLMVFSAISAFVLPALAPVATLAQDNDQPRRERSGGSAHRAAPREDRSTQPTPQERPQPQRDRDSNQDRGNRPDRGSDNRGNDNRGNDDRGGNGGWNGGVNGGRPDRPDQDRPGQGRPDQGRPDQGRPAQGRPDRPGNGNGGWNGGGRPDRPDQGRPDNGRPGSNGGWNGNGPNRPDGWNNGGDRGRDRDRQRNDYRRNFDSNRWQQNWNRSHRSDWWRNDNRFRGWNGVRFGFYFAPGYGYYSVPRSYYGRTYREGDYLPSIFWRYSVNDYRTYGLGYPPVGTRWVYVDNAIYLIDQYDGYIIDVIRDAWRW